MLILNVFSSIGCSFRPSTNWHFYSSLWQYHFLCDSVAPWVNIKVTGEVFVLLQPLHFQNAAQAWSARFISLIAVPHCRRAPVFLLRDYGVLTSHSSSVPVTVEWITSSLNSWIDGLNAILTDGFGLEVTMETALSEVCCSWVQIWTLKPVGDWRKDGEKGIRNQFLKDYKIIKVHIYFN